MVIEDHAEAQLVAVGDKDLSGSDPRPDSRDRFVAAESDDRIRLRQPLVRQFPIELHAGREFHGQGMAKFQEFQDPGGRYFAEIMRPDEQPANQALEPSRGRIAADNMENGLRPDGLGEMPAVRLKIIECLGVAEFGVDQREQIVGRQSTEKRKCRRRLREMRGEFTGLHAVRIQAGI